MASHLDWREPDWESARSIGILDETSSEVNVKSQPINLSYCLIFFFLHARSALEHRKQKSSCKLPLALMPTRCMQPKNSSYCVHKLTVNMQRGLVQMQDIVQLL